METIKLNDVEYYLVEKDKAKFYIEDVYNIMGIFGVSLIDDKWVVTGKSGYQDRLKYPKGNQGRGVRLLGFEEAMDFYTADGKFHSRISSEFYFKAKKLIEALALDYEILLNETPNSPVLFKMTDRDYGVLVAPRLIEEPYEDTVLPIGFVKEAKA